MKGKLIELKELKDYYIGEDITKLHKNISYKRFFILMCILMSMTKFNEEDQEEVCFKILDYYVKELNKVLNNKDYQKINEFSRKIKLSGSISGGYFTKIEKTVKNDKENLVILEGKNIYYPKKFLEYFPTDFLILPSYKVKDIDLNDYISYLEDIPIDFNFEYLKDTKDLFNIKLTKKDNIIIKLSQNNFMFYPETYGQIKTPKWLTTITYSLMNLKKGGNLILSLTLVKQTETFRKIFELLSDCFKFHNATTFDYSLVLGHVMSLENYKDNLQPKILDKLKQISLESLQYNYDFCDYFNYFYHNQEINYYLEDFPYKPVDKKIYIVDDIDIEIKPSKRNKIFSQREESYFQSQMDIINEQLNRNISEGKNEEILLNKDYFERSTYEKLVRKIKFLHINNRPIDNSFLVYIQNYNKLNLEKIFNLEDRYEISKFPIINFRYRKIPFYNFTSYQTYTYDVLDAQQILLYKESELRRRIDTENEEEKIPVVYQKILDDFSKNIVRYIKKKLSLDTTPDFLKLWEIYSTFDLLEKESNVFILGNNIDDSVKCTKKFCKNNVNIIPDKNLNKLSDYKTIIQMGKENINANLVVCNSNTDSKNLIDVQKYELGKILSVLTVVRNNGNCIVKHTLPFNMNIKKSNKSNGFFVNIMLIYYLNFKTIEFYKPITSDINDLEFYVIGKDFSGISKENYNIFMNAMKNFETNMCFYQKDSIYDVFIQQIYNFIDQIQTINYKRYKEENFLYTCLNDISQDVKKDLGCDTILNEDNIDKVIEKSSKKWIENFKFK